MNCGDGRLPRPSMGSWVTYGLGSENQNLPGFIAMCPGGYPIQETQNWQAAFPSPFAFRKYGQSGIEVSELFPHVASCIDDIAVIRSMHADVPNHEPSLLLLNCGEARQIRPSLGSWVTYGLGSESENLPGFVVMATTGDVKGGPPVYGNGFLPGTHQPTVLRSAGSPVVRSMVGW